MRRPLASPEGRLALIAVAVFALMAALSPDRFLSAQNLASMAFQFPEFAILALAVTVAMLTGGIDLSVVGVSNLSAVIAALLLGALGGAEAGAGVLALGYGAALAVGLVAGLFNGLLVAGFGLPPILATLGSGLIFTGLAVALTGGSAVMGLPAAAAWLGNDWLLGVPVPLVLFAALAAGLAWLLSRTAFGVKVRMLGRQPARRPLRRDGRGPGAGARLRAVRRALGNGGARRHVARQLGQGGLRLVLPAARGPHRGARRREPLRRLWAHRGRRAWRSCRCSSCPRGSTCSRSRTSRGELIWGALLIAVMLLKHPPGAPPQTERLRRLPGPLGAKPRKDARAWAAGASWPRTPIRGLDRIAIRSTRSRGQRPRAPFGPGRPGSAGTPWSPSGPQLS